MARMRKGSRRRSKGFFGRFIGLATSPIGWVAMAAGALVVALVGGKLKETIEGVAGKIKPATK